MAALLERIGAEPEVETLVEDLAVEAAQGRVAASQAGARIAAKVLSTATSDAASFRGV